MSAERRFYYHKVIKTNKKKSKISNNLIWKKTYRFSHKYKISTLKMLFHKRNTKVNIETKLFITVCSRLYKNFLFPNNKTSF